MKIAISIPIIYKQVELLLDRGSGTEITFLLGSRITKEIMDDSTNEYIIFIFQMIRKIGEVSSRCDMEAANILALNLMNDIVTGKLTVEKARDVYCEVTSAFMMNRPAAYAEKLQFTVSKEANYDTDIVMIADEMVEQAIKKVNDIVDESRGNGRIH